MANLWHMRIGGPPAEKVNIDFFFFLNFCQHFLFNFFKRRILKIAHLWSPKMLMWIRRCPRLQPHGEKKRFTILMIHDVDQHWLFYFKSYIPEKVTRFLPLLPLLPLVIMIINKLHVQICPWEFLTVYAKGGFINHLSCDIQCCFEVIQLIPRKLVLIRVTGMNLNIVKICICE